MKIKFTAKQAIWILLIACGIFVSLTLQLHQTSWGVVYGTRASQ